MFFYENKNRQPAKVKLISILISMNKIRAAITGVQGYVPEYVLTNKELETLVDTTDEWITSRTGIKERHILKEKTRAVR